MCPPLPPLGGIFTNSIGCLSQPSIASTMHGCLLRIQLLRNNPFLSDKFSNRVLIVNLLVVFPTIIAGSIFFLFCLIVLHNPPQNSLAWTHESLPKTSYAWEKPMGVWLDDLTEYATTVRNSSKWLLGSWSSLSSKSWRISSILLLLDILSQEGQHLTWDYRSSIRASVFFPYCNIGQEILLWICFHYEIWFHLAWGVCGKPGRIKDSLSFSSPNLKPTQDWIHHSHCMLLF